MYRLNVDDIFQFFLKHNPQFIADLIGMPNLAAEIPVSYTHLRAHETVLDLVCRLLLENKTPPPPPAASGRVDGHSRCALLPII